MLLEENPVISTLLHQATPGGRQSKKGRFLHMFNLLSLLSSGCKVVALLGRPRKALLSNSLITCTLFGYRRGRVSLAIQEEPKLAPDFVIELPILTNALHKEMASGLVRIALESETMTHRKKFMDESIWGVCCNGRKIGYSSRRKQTSEVEVHVMQLLRGVSMGAGVLPCPSDKESVDGELTYMRARFERVVGSKDSEALYIVNPDRTSGPELSIFFVKVQ
ncbi:protein MIZU-KUSSEI 1-like [Aristolochia californica]|uniref:protein MIZU-KUSSEI 1-like n=1 Tax=Aristolochia californica TaxID=171875 RepID=UPI0035DDF3E3